MFWGETNLMTFDNGVEVSLSTKFAYINVFRDDGMTVLQSDTSSIDIENTDETYVLTDVKSSFSVSVQGGIATPTDEE